jgi:pimeloyl-ACP methyl ester carboxylesterase
MTFASSQMNHFVIDVGDPLHDRLGEISASTLVVHGAEDPVFPLGHALRLRSEARATTI